MSTNEQKAIGLMSSGLLSLTASHEELRRQRDELLAAAKYALEWIMEARDRVRVPISTTTVRMLRTAIAKATLSTEQRLPQS